MDEEIYIESLGIYYLDEMIITDVDDCLLKTTETLKRLGIDHQEFFYNPVVYEELKEYVFTSAPLTDWGIEFLKLVRNGTITNFKLLTAARNRMDILKEIFRISPDNIIQGKDDPVKLQMLENIDNAAIYVDDKISVIKKIQNPNIVAVQFPPETVKIVRVKRKRKRL